MPRPTRIAPAVLAAMVFLAAGPPVGAIPRPPDDLTPDRDALGTAFVESWLAFRHDLDSLAHLPVHPALLEAWFAGAPRFLLRDALRLAAEPRVVAAAARALAEGADDDDRELLAETEARHPGSALADEIRGARIRAGDAGALGQARADLADQRVAVRERAAFALAAAGRREGLKALRELAARHANESPLSVRALGLFGAPADDRLLRGLERDTGNRGIARIARGEIALRAAFPDHHRALADRDCALTRLRVAGGLYDIWLEAILGAIESGARTSSEIVAHVESLRRAAAGDEGEVVRRNLEVLVEFWRQVDARIAATGPEPAWPTGMGPALELIREPRRADEPPARTAQRVAAMIAICAWTGGALDHGEMRPARSGVRAITPRGARALDLNPATSFHLARGGALVLELPDGARPREALIANSCADGAGPRLRRVEIVVSAGPSRYAVEAPLTGATRYFQRIPLAGKSASRLEIRALETDGEGPACIAEIRVR